MAYGEDNNLSEISEKIGRPRAGSSSWHSDWENPLLMVIPCHRVIGSEDNWLPVTVVVCIRATLLTIRTVLKGGGDEQLSMVYRTMGKNLQEDGCCFLLLTVGVFKLVRIGKQQQEKVAFMKNFCQMKPEEICRAVA